MLTRILMSSTLSNWCDQNGMLYMYSVCQHGCLGMRKTSLWPADMKWNFDKHISIELDVIMGKIASQTTSLTIVYSTVYSDEDQRKHQSSASLAFVRGIHRGPVNSPHKWPVTRKMLPFDDVIMNCRRKVVDHSDVVEASPVGAASTTSSFSTWRLASIDCTKTTARRKENNSSFGIWCALY